MARDPTRTIVLRRAYAAAARKRMKLVRAAIVAGVGEANVFGLGSNPPKRPVLLQAESPEVRRLLAALRAEIEELQIRAGAATGRARAALLAQATDAARAFVSVPGKFAFPTSAEKLAAFDGWLSEMTDTGVMEVLRNADGSILEEAGWSRLYVRRAYVKGFSFSTAKLRAAGADVPPRFDDVNRELLLPIHRDALELLYARNLSELTGVTAAMGAELRRQLAAGMAAGLNPKETARRMARAVDEIGIRRAVLIARTETIRSFAESSLNRYAEFGVGKVSAEVEFATAGDDRVCPVCSALDGSLFTIQEAKDVIPVHPDCRCAWLPAFDAAEAPISLNAVRDLRARYLSTWPGWYRHPFEFAA